MTRLVASQEAIADQLAEQSGAPIADESVLFSYQYLLDQTGIVDQKQDFSESAMLGTFAALR